MKLKNYNKEYVFLKEKNKYYELIPADQIKEYIKENELVFFKIYGTKKTKWLEDIKHEIEKMIVTNAEYEGVEDIQDRLDFENKDFKKGVEYLQKFIDKARENIYDVDLDIEIEIGDDE